MADEKTPMDADELMNLFDRVEHLPASEAEWVSRLLEECMRARMHEAELLSAAGDAPGTDDCRNEAEQQRATHLAPHLAPHLAQLALDTAEWLKTLWNVGYMGAGGFPVQPRSSFPTIELEDVLKSALFARIRQGKRPLPFPPPTRQGSPWHELLESGDEIHTVDAEIVRETFPDGQGAAVGAIVEGCSDWRIVEEVRCAREYLIQHQGKGPIYRLRLDVFSAELRREAPLTTRRIYRQERGGFCSYSLEWPHEDGKVQWLTLRAATWERAESEAEHWIATKYPAMLGQIRFQWSE
jgi:hypothetical protein